MSSTVIDAVRTEPPERESAPPARSGRPLGAQRAISLVAVMGLFWPLLSAWGQIVTVPSAGLAVIALCGGGLWLTCAIATAKDGARLERLDLALLALAVLVLMSYAAAKLYASSSYGTDEAAFEQGAAQLLLHGHNPYGANLLGSLSAFSVPAKYATYTMSGGMVSTLGYPAFPVLVAAVFVQLTGGGQAVPIADVAALILAVVLVFRALPTGVARTGRRCLRRLPDPDQLRSGRDERDHHDGGARRGGEPVDPRRRDGCAQPRRSALRRRARPRAGQQPARVVHRPVPAHRHLPRAPRSARTGPRHG